MAHSWKHLHRGVRITASLLNILNSVLSFFYGSLFSSKGLRSSHIQHTGNHILDCRHGVEQTASPLEEEDTDGVGGSIEDTVLSPCADDLKLGSEYIKIWIRTRIASRVAKL